VKLLKHTKDLKYELLKRPGRRLNTTIKMTAYVDDVNMEKVSMYQGKERAQSKQNSIFLQIN
jgi:hypothetical protein